MHQKGLHHRSEGRVSLWRLSNAPGRMTCMSALGCGCAEEHFFRGSPLSAAEQPQTPPAPVCGSGCVTEAVNAVVGTGRQQLVPPPSALARPVEGWEGTDIVSILLSAVGTSLLGNKRALFCFELAAGPGCLLPPRSAGLRSVPLPCIVPWAHRWCLKGLRWQREGWGWAGKRGKVSCVGQQPQALRRDRLRCCGLTGCPGGE